MALIRAQHKVSGGVADVPDNDYYRQLGWEPCDPNAPLTAELAAQADAGGFDPADHNVDDVVTYLASAGPAERERVLAAERAGKGRAGVLNSPADAGA